MFPRRMIWGLCHALLVACLLQPSPPACGQSSVSSTSLRPFVVGWVPVIGRNGRVGGVAVDAEGVLTRVQVDDAALAASRKSIRADAKTKLRMVSLARLEQALSDHVERGEPITEEMLFLAGLQRIEYVFAIPEQNDIVLAGPGESWRVDRGEVAIGVTTGQPTARLDDLLEAFRTARLAAESPGITCSIDPTPEGIARMQRLFRNRNLAFNQRTMDLMRKAVGPHRITVTGVLPDSHFARVMVAADYVMKRLAMDLEESPVAGMPSYLEMLKSAPLSSTRTASPRWWMAVSYDPLLRSEDGLSWQLRGRGVQVLTQDAFVNSAGAIIESDRTDRLAMQWAQTMTDKYSELSAAEPVFGELRCCMDLAVVAALITHYELAERSGARLPTLMGNNRIRGPRYDVPTQVESHVSFVRADGAWIVSVSGGIDLDSWSILNRSATGPIRQLKPSPSEQAWWWE